MSIIELLLRTLSQLKDLLPGLLAGAALTVVALAILLACQKNTWVQNRRFWLVSLFFGLDGRRSLWLACAWLKLIFLIVFVAGFQKLTTLHYWMFLVPGFLAVLCEKGFVGKLGSLFWLLLQTVGLLSVNLICGFIRDMAGGIGFRLLYGVMGLFLVLFSIYLFLGEVKAISTQREVNAEEIWNPTEEA